MLEVVASKSQLQAMLIRFEAFGKCVHMHSIIVADRNQAQKIMALTLQWCMQG